MKHVIALSGKRLSGKDSVAAGLGRFVRLKFMAEMYQEMLGLGFTENDIREHKEILRPLMLALGDARRFFDADYYAKIGIRQCRDSGTDRMVITDLRCQNEARLLRELGRESGWKITLVRIERPNFVRDLPADSHPTETDLDLWTDWDLIVNAKSGEMEKLKAAAEDLLRITE